MENKSPFNLLAPPTMSKSYNKCKMCRQQRNCKSLWHKNLFWNEFEVYRPEKTNSKAILDHSIQLAQINNNIQWKNHQIFQTIDAKWKVPEVDENTPEIKGSWYICNWMWCYKRQPQKDLQNHFSTMWKWVIKLNKWHPRLRSQLQ